MKTDFYKKIINELIHVIDEGVYIVDKQGKGMFYNHTMADLEKVNLDDVLGKKFHEAFPDFNEEDSTLLKALTKNESTLKQQQTYKNFYGKEVTTVNSTIPIVMDGETVAAIEVAKDITDFRQMTDKLMELGNNAMSKEAASGEMGQVRRDGIRRYSFEDICGEDPDFKEVVMRAKRAAENDASVFIYGETGTGKELFAQSIHYGGKRKNKPFIAQNCAAIPESLLEGLLFGTAKGGFTGAVDRAGLFEQANGGTLLLDEISAMPYDLQSKLLRVLQENYIRRVGGTKDIPVDVRIIATVNETPEELMDGGKLRKDLYYRLNVVNISIPPLRERTGDVRVLAETFLEKHNRKFGKELWMIADDAVEKLSDYEYPGNVRELENIIEQAVSMAGKEHVLTAKLLNMPSPARKGKSAAHKYQGEEPLNEYLERIEKQIIRETMFEADGNISKAADMLQIKRQTLQHKLKKYKLSE